MSINVVNPLDREIGYSEALATWTTRYVDSSGFGCVLSIQAETGAEVLKKAEGAIAYLGEAKCLPFHLGNHNGNGQEKASTSEAIVEVKQEGSTETRICPIHNLPMKLWTKSWFAHRWDSGWCHGREK